MPGREIVARSRLSHSLFSIQGKKIFLHRVRHAQTFWQRFKGLMGVSPSEHDYALVFHMLHEDQLGASIHMLFMRMPLDVLWLDEKKKIVDFATLKPWVFNYTPVKPAKYVVELPAETIGKLNVRGGVTVVWK